MFFQRIWTINRSVLPKRKANRHLMSVNLFASPTVGFSVSDLKIAYKRWPTSDVSLLRRTCVDLTSFHSSKVTLVLSVTNSLSVQLQSICHAGHDLDPYFAGVQLLHRLTGLPLSKLANIGTGHRANHGCSFPVL